MQQKKIVFLASDCESSRWVYNALIQDFTIEAAIIEKPVSKKTLIKGRIKKIGLPKVMGQVFFSAFVVPFLKIMARRRRAFLVNEYQLTDTHFIEAKTHYVASVNDDACKTLLQQLQPDIIIVNGTRIINKKILQCCRAVFINMHVGITPRYRGSHGGYWALYHNDPENFGTTIHLVDSGVDTGAVIKQIFTKPAPNDNFVTYPILQVSIGIGALKNVLQEALTGNLKATSHTEKGRMYYQPAVWEYFLNKRKQ
jgi:folate-dependent phosphoribosylglycinamide formyltransferase PurN